MCQFVVNLAERDGQRYVSQCEHGTVHLVWDAVGLHLPADAFRQLAINILRTAEEVLTQPEGTERGHCRLQVGRIAVELPLADFLLMAAMVDEALPEVSRTETRARCTPPQLTFPQTQPSLLLN